MREPYRINVISGGRDTDRRETEHPVSRRSESPEAIRADIERTRREMGATVDAIQERLNPGYLAEQAKLAIKEAISDVSEHAKDTVREATVGRAEHAVSSAGESARTFGMTLTETIRQNPIPALLTGIGLGWLFMKSREVDGRAIGRRTDLYRTYPRSEAGYGYGPYGPYELQHSGTTGVAGQVAGSTREMTSDTVASVKETAGAAAAKAQETVSDVTARTQETISDVSARAQEQVQYRTRQVRGQFEQLMDENPLAMGAAAIACGAALGLFLPSTRKEDELMGEARDSLVESARETAQGAMQKVQRVAEEAQTAAKEEAQDQGLAA